MTGEPSIASEMEDMFSEGVTEEDLLETEETEELPEKKTEDLPVVEEEAPETEEEEEVPEEKDLMTQMREMMAEFVAAQNKANTPAVDKVEEEAPSHFEMSDEEYQSLSTKEGAEALFTKMMNSAIEKATLKIPKIAQTVAAQQVLIQRKVGDFYRENKDLVPYRGIVQRTTIEIENEHKDWDIDKILSEAAIASRKLLRLQAGKKAATSQKELKPKPGFPVGARSMKGKGVKPTAFQQEFNELFGKR